MKSQAELKAVDGGATGAARGEQLKLPRADEPAVVTRAMRFVERNVRWANRNDAWTLNHAVLLARYGMLKAGQPWIESDGVVFMGANVDIKARKGMGHLRFGKFVWIGNDCGIRCHEGHLSVGDKTVFGSNNVVNCYLDIEIGRECIFADWIYVCDFDHRFDDPHLPIRSQGIKVSPIKIGNGVWIANKVTITRGVTIGDGAVVAANAVVNSDVPPGAVVGGAPARVLKMRPGFEDAVPEQREGRRGW